MQISSQTATPTPGPGKSVSASPSSSYVRWAMTAIILGGYISVLNSHVINVVIPKMMSGLGTDVVTIRWVVTAFMLANAVVMPLVGWLARTIGSRDLYLIGLVLFTGSAMLCGAATNVSMLIVMRIIQGVGGGLIMPVTMLLMLDLYPPEKRGLGTAIWGMGASCGSLTGIPLGGIVAEQLSWRAAFFINVPPGVAALLITYFIIRPSVRERGIPFDWWGFLTLATALISLLLGLSNGQRDGWDSPMIVGLFVLFGLALMTFILVEPRVKAPMIDLSTFRSRPYVIAIVLSLIAGGMFSGGPFLVSLLLQQMYDLSVQNTALILFPSSAFLVLCTSLTGWASDRIDARYLMVVGYLCYACFGVMMVFADLRLSPFVILFIYFGRGLGLGLSYPVLYPVGISAFPATKAKTATTILNLCVTLGGALTVSLLAALLDQRHQVRQTLLAETQFLPDAGTQQALQSLETLAMRLGGGLTPSTHAKVLLGRLIDHEAMMLAFNDCFAVFVLLSFCGIVLTFFFRRARPGAN